MPSTCPTLLSPRLRAIDLSSPLPRVATVCAGNSPVVALAGRGHCKHKDLPIVALPPQAVNLPDVPVAVRAGNLAVATLIVRGHCERGSLPVIALAARGHRKRSNLSVLAHTNYLPNVALATCAIDLPVVTLAAHARDTLLSPAASHALALIASC